MGMKNRKDVDGGLNTQAVREVQVYRTQRSPGVIEWSHSGLSVRH